MRIPLPLPIAAIVGFLAVAGGFSGGLAMAVGRDTALPLPVAAGQDPEDPPSIQVYHPLPDQLIVSLADGRTVITSVTLSVEAPVEVLISLQATATERQADLMAALVATAQDTAQTQGSEAALRSALPLRLAAVLNDRLGLEALAEPVKEVLLTDFLLR